MARYKGAVKPAATEREFPHLVEMLVPGGGFRRLMDEFQAFHRERGIPERRGRGRREHAGGFYVTWCFADPATADAFKERFGGERYTAKS